MKKTMYDIDGEADRCFRRHLHSHPFMAPHDPLFGPEAFNDPKNLDIIGAGVCSLPPRSNLIREDPYWDLHRLDLWWQFCRFLEKAGQWLTKLTRRQPFFLHSQAEEYQTLKLSRK